MSAHNPFSADYTDASAMSAALLAQSDLLCGMAADVGRAKTVLAYSGDRLKRALALAIADALAAGATSHAAAEARARASTAFRDSLDALSASDEAAEKIVAQWFAEQAKHEALRSCVALEKAKAQIL